MASSLAQVTCREPLRSALHAHLRKLLETGPLVGLPPDEKERILENVVPVSLLVHGRRGNTPGVGRQSKHVGEEWW